MAPRGYITKGIRVNDSDRADWVSNVEGLYTWMLSEHKGMTAFVRAHRAEIDEVIREALTREPLS